MLNYVNEHVLRFPRALGAHENERSGSADRRQRMCVNRSHGERYCFADGFAAIHSKEDVFGCA